MKLEEEDSEVNQPKSTNLNFGWVDVDNGVANIKCAPSYLYFSNLPISQNVFKIQYKNLHTFTFGLCVICGEHAHVM